MPSSNASSKHIPVGQQVVVLQLDTLQKRGALRAYQVQAVKKRIRHLSEASLELFGQILHDTPPKYLRELVPVFTDWPESAILTLDSKLNVFLTHPYSLSRLQQEVARVEISPNASPMLCPILRDAMDFPDGMDHLTHLGLLSQWVEAYRFQATGALTILEEAHQQTMQASTLNLLSERLNQIPAEKLARPFTLCDLAALDDDGIKSLMAAKEPVLMQTLAYDYNRGDYDDVIEKQIAQEQVVPYRIPTALGESIIHQVALGREHRRDVLLQEIKTLLEPFVPKNDHGYLYSRLDTLAPTVQSADHLQQFIKRALWIDPAQLQHYPAVTNGQLHVANPSPSRVKELIQLLEDMPSAPLKSMLHPNEHPTYMPGVEAMGAMMRAYTPADEEYKDAYSVWEKDFTLEKSKYLNRTDVLAFYKVAGWLRDNQCEQLIYTDPARVQMLLEAQAKLYTNQNVAHVMDRLQQELKHHLEGRKQQFSNKALRILNLDMPMPSQVDEEHLLRLPKDKLRAALQAISMDQPENPSTRKVMIETLSAIAAMEQPKLPRLNK